jgi:hypothetical protein
LKILCFKSEKKLSTKKKPQEVLTREEDMVLIQLWLNISKNSIVEVDQNTYSFWLRIASNYNKYCGQLREKTIGQLKAQWHRINGFDQKFVVVTN